MEDLYLSVAAVVVVAAIAVVFLRAKPYRIFYVVIVANIVFAGEAAYFVSWLAVLPCLFIIAFMLTIMSHPQIRPDRPDRG